MKGKKTAVYYEIGKPVEKINNYGMRIISPFNDRRLEIYDLKTCRKAIIFKNTGLKKWIECAKAIFYYKDCDASDYRIREYFGFFGENVTQTYPN